MFIACVVVGCLFPVAVVFAGSICLLSLVALSFVACLVSLTVVLVVLLPVGLSFAAVGFGWCLA